MPPVSASKAKRAAEKAAKAAAKASTTSGSLAGSTISEVTSVATSRTGSTEDLSSDLKNMAKITERYVVGTAEDVGHCGLIARLVASIDLQPVCLCRTRSPVISSSTLIRYPSTVDCSSKMQKSLSTTEIDMVFWERTVLERFVGARRCRCYFSNFFFFSVDLPGISCRP